MEDLVWGYGNPQPPLFGRGMIGGRVPSTVMGSRHQTRIEMKITQ